MPSSSRARWRGWQRCCRSCAEPSGPRSRPGSSGASHRGECPRVPAGAVWSMSLRRPKIPQILRPPARILWHGMMSGIGLRDMARPTARAAPANPRCGPARHSLPCAQSRPPALPHRPSVEAADARQINRHRAEVYDLARQVPLDCRDRLVDPRGGFPGPPLADLLPAVALLRCGRLRAAAAASSPARSRRRRTFQWPSRTGSRAAA